jgi:hypothetical protein
MYVYICVYTFFFKLCFDIKKKIGTPSPAPHEILWGPSQAPTLWVSSYRSVWSWRSSICQRCIPACKRALPWSSSLTTVPDKVLGNSCIPEVG